MSKFYVENLGCAKNQVDAEVMISSLKKQGWIHTPDNPDEADLIIVNTCGFIKQAQEESVNTLLGTQNQYPGKRVIAAGCLAQRWSKELKNLIPELDGVFGNKAPQLVGEVANTVMEGEKAVYVPDVTDGFQEREYFFGFKRSAYVKISEGCNHNCRFCAIPLIKGRLRSRPMDELLNEIKGLLNRNIFELNLIAQDLASWGRDRGETQGLLELLKRILEEQQENKNFWVRLLYLHPDNFPRELLTFMAKNPRILPYLDIPFQHASTSVLRKMGRAGDRATHLDLIREIRETVPNAVIRSTFLVGHPGETHREFNELLRFQEEAQLDWLGVFTWSREEGTAAAKDRGALVSRLLAPIAVNRQKTIEKRQIPITEKRLQQWLGYRGDVLIEEPVEGENFALGRTFFQAPEVDGSIVVHSGKLSPGEVVRVRITKQTGVDLQGVIDG